MADYIFVYHGGKPPTDPAEVEKVMGAWNDFYQGLGDKVVNGGGPLGMSSTVSKSGVAGNGGANPASGFTVVKAASQDEANKMAKGCPILDEPGGSVEVAEIIVM